MLKLLYCYSPPNVYRVVDAIVDFSDALDMANFVGIIIDGASILCRYIMFKRSSEAISLISTATFLCHSLDIVAYQGDGGSGPSSPLEAISLHLFFVSTEDGAVATIDVGLAYRDDTLSEWTEMAHSIEQRKLSCNFTTEKVNPNICSC